MKKLLLLVLLSACCPEEHPKTREQRRIQECLDLAPEGSKVVEFKGESGWVRWAIIELDGHKFLMQYCPDAPLRTVITPYADSK